MGAREDLRAVVEAVNTSIQGLLYGDGVPQSWSSEECRRPTTLHQFHLYRRTGLANEEHTSGASKRARQPSRDRRHERKLATLFSIGFFILKALEGSSRWFISSPSAYRSHAP